MAQPCLSEREAFYVVGANLSFRANDVAALLELLIFYTLFTGAFGRTSMRRLQDCLTTLFSTQAALIEAFEREWSNKLRLWVGSKKRFVRFDFDTYDAVSSNGLSCLSAPDGADKVYSFHFLPKFLLAVFACGARGVWFKGRRGAPASAPTLELVQAMIFESDDADAVLERAIIDRMRPLKTDAKKWGALKQSCGEMVAKALANLGHAHPHRKAFLLDACLAYVRGPQQCPFLPREEQHRVRAFWSRSPISNRRRRSLLVVSHS